MKQIEATLSSTLVDKHGDMMTREALEFSAETFNTHCVPIGYEHDPRHAPLGRFVEAWIEDLPSGVSVLKARGDLFEPNDTLPSEIGKPIVEKHHPGGPLRLAVDLSYAGIEFRDDITSISDILGSRVQYEVKKAVEPISILILSGTFVFGAIASGFFGGIGTDAYELLKARLKAMLAKQRKRSKEQLLVFEFTVSHLGHRVAVHTIVTNPDDVAVDSMLGKALYDLDEISPDLFSDRHHLSRLVYMYDNGTLSFLYGVREDGYPVNIRKVEPGSTANHHSPSA
jgi:hypothetical protein